MAQAKGVGLSLRHVLPTVALCVAVFTVCDAASLRVRNPVEADKTFRYTFDNTLSSTNGGPELTQTASSGYNYERASVFGTERSVLTFNAGSGLKATFPGLSGTYTIRMVFKFNNVTPYGRLIDWSNLSKDIGLYTKSGALNLYNVAQGGSVSADTWTNLTVTRDGNNKLTCYLNGEKVLEFDDSGNAYTTPNNVLIFFKDNGSSEDQAGSVALITVSSKALSGQVINDSDAFAPVATPTETTPAKPAGSMAGFYTFDNNLGSYGSGPDLVKMSPGGTNYVFKKSDVAGIERSVMAFTKGSGLRATFPGVGEEYTISMLFRFQDVTPYGRLIDWSGGTKDIGLYTKDGKMNLYNVAQGGSVSANTWTHMVITRDAVTNKIVCYVNGNVAFEYTDTGKAYVSTNGALIFFKDDGASEDQAGSVAQLSVSDSALSASAAKAMDPFAVPSGASSPAPAPAPTPAVDPEPAATPAIEAAVDSKAGVGYTFADLEANGPGPKLIKTNPGPGHYQFAKQVVMGDETDVMMFTKGSGLRATFPGVGEAYTISMVFKFDSVTPYGRLIDWSGGTKDIGLYTKDGKMNLYNVAQGGSVSANTWTHMVITRDAVTNKIVCYVNGNVAFEYTDTGKAYVSTNGALIFFKDDGASEDQAGTVAQLSVSDRTMSADDVKSFDPFASSPAPAPTSAPAPAPEVEASNIGVFAVNSTVTPDGCMSQKADAVPADMWGGKFTLLARVKVAEAPGWQDISTRTNCAGFLLGLKDNTWRFGKQCDGGSHGLFPGAAKAQSGQSYSVATTYDGVTSTLFVDGEKIGELKTSMTFENDEPILVGCSNPETFSEKWKGHICGFQVFQGALSGDEIERLSLDLSYMPCPMNSMPFSSPPPTSSP